jgi:hypothetical protein
MSHHQPAAELIANALAKIKKLAGNKKHADLAQQCQTLIDSIQEVSCGCVAWGHALHVLRATHMPAASSGTCAVDDTPRHGASRLPY